METYCKIFLNTSRDRDQLLADILSLISADSFVIYNFENSLLDGNLNKNDEFDADRSLDPEDGFLYYPYYLDIDTDVPFNQAYFEQIVTLMKYFKEQGISTVAACDFEDELNAAVNI